jgi:hypothetical protein
MNRQPEPKPHRVKNPAYRRAFERLDAALEKNSSFNRAEIIAAMRKAAFADVDELVASGRLLKFPNYKVYPTKSD